MRPVPSIRLLWLAGLVVIPATTVIVYAGGVTGLLGWLLLLTFLLAGLTDYLISLHLLDQLSVELPSLVRSTVGRELPIPVDFLNRGEAIGKLRYGIGVSSSFRIEGEVIGTVADLLAGKRRSVSYQLTPLRRGQFFLEALYVEIHSRLGLWQLHKKFPLTTEVRVYPDLRQERKRLASLFLMRGHDGSHAVRQVGKGREFEQLREYQPGDDYIDVDWKATARRRLPVTRTYQIERTQEVYVVVDHSRLSAREIRVPVTEASEGDWLYQESSAGGEYAVTTQLEKFLHTALILSSVAERQGDLFGFVSFADKVDRFIRARNGKQHYNIVRDALYTLEPSRVAPDFEQLMISLRQRLTRRALIVMLIDLSDPLTAEHFYDALPLIHRQHLVLVNMVRPEQAHPLFTPHHVPESSADIYAALGGHLQWQELRDIGKRLQRLGVELGIPDHAELCASVVTQYLTVKRRQLI